MEAEKTIHQCCPSQIVNLKHFIVSAIILLGIVAIAILTGEMMFLTAALLPLGFALWKYLDVKNTRLTITDQRLIVAKGIFNRRTNETELYRVRDTSIEEPFFYRMCGVGNVIVYSTDEAEGKLLFNAFSRPHWIKDQIRNYSEECRQRKRWGTDNILIHDINQ